MMILDFVKFKVLIYKTYSAQYLLGTGMHFERGWTEDWLVNYAKYKEKI